MEKQLAVKEIQDASKVLSETIKIAEMVGICRSTAIQHGMKQVLDIVGVDIREMFRLNEPKSIVENDNWMMVIETLEENQGMSPSELALKTGTNPSTVKTWLRRMTLKGILSNVNGRYYTWATETTEAEGACQEV